MPVQAYDEPRTRAFFSQLLQELENVPGVQTVGFGSREPPSTSRDFTAFRLPGEDQNQQKMVMVQRVSPGYFEVLRIPILVGRNFKAADASRPVVLINESMARRYWQIDSPVGRTIVMGQAAREIVGIVKNSYTVGLDQIEPMLYLPFTASPTSRLLLRTTKMDSSKVVGATVARLDPRVRIKITPLSEILDRWLAPSNVGAMIAGILGAFALLLASVGMFGVFAYVVQQRTQEIGIRMALGARPRQVIGLLIGTNARAVLIGLAIGFAGAVAGSRLLGRFLFGLSPLDPVAYGEVALLLASAGVLATYWPARRATKTDPVKALRYE